MALENVMRVDNGNVIDGSMPQTYPASHVMMSDGETSVEDTLDELTDDSGIITLNDNIKYRKVGHIVEVIIQIPSTSTTALTTLGTLPAKCAPGISFYDCPYDNGSVRALFYIRYDGTVQYVNNSGTTITAVKTYIANVTT